MDSEDSRASSGRLDRAAIEELVPHRDPFLFVDRVIERESDRITTEWDVREDLECLRGHYPGQPILPGVLITEFALQSGALLVSGTGQGGESIPVVTRIERARFKRVVRPGTTLRARVELTQRLSGAHYFSGRVTAKGATVAHLGFVLAIASEGG